MNRPAILLWLLLVQVCAGQGARGLAGDGSRLRPGPAPAVSSSLSGSSDTGPTNCAPGVWLCRLSGDTTFYGTNGTALRNAYTDAASGDTITLGAGLYDMRNQFVLDKSVGIIGCGSGVWDGNASQFVGGTILLGYMTPTATMTNCVLAHLAMEHYGDVCLFAAWWTNVLNIRFVDIAVGCLSHTNDHNIQFSGENIEVDGLRSYNGGANGIVFKGVRNVTARNLSSYHDRGNCVYVKASSWQGGNVENVQIQNVISDGSGSAIVQAVDPPSSLGRVQIQGLEFSAITPYAGTFWVECRAGCSLTNVQVSNVVSSGGPWLATIVAGGLMKSVTFDTCNIRDFSPAFGKKPVFVFAQSPNDFRAFRGQNIHIGLSGINQVGQVARALTTLTRATGSFLSVGVLAGNIRQTYVTNNSLYVCWPAAFRIDTNYLAVGDPMRIDGGPLEGVYTNSGFGVSAAADQPVPGAVPGDNYVILSGIAGTFTNGPYLSGGLQPGKILARLWASDYWIAASLEVKAGAENSVAHTFESGSVRCGVNADGSGHTRLAGGVVPTGNATVVFPLYPWVFQSGDHVDIALFGGGAGNSFWYPAYFFGAHAQVTAQGYPVNIEDADSW